MNELPPGKLAALSLILSGIGETYSMVMTINPDVFLQHATWTVAILAGIVSIINTVVIWCKKRKNGKE